MSENSYNGQGLTDRVGETRFDRVGETRRNRVVHNGLSGGVRDSDKPDVDSVSNIPSLNESA